MDVDGEEDDETGAVDSEDEADEDVDMEGVEEEDQASQKKRKAKAKAKKPRKSELNLEALQNEAVAVAALQSDQLQQTRLKRKYYAECLTFIRQIEGGTKIIEMLLASNSKPEVLEAIDFFRVIHEYQLDGAEVGAYVL